MWITIRLLDALGRALDRLSRICLYLAAGLSRLTDLRRTTIDVWNDFLTHDEGEALTGWMRWEQIVAERTARPGDRVLIIGCGSGRDMLPFIERGCRVTGVDPAPRAVAAARTTLARRHLTAELYVGFFEDCSLTDRYEVVWFSWFAFSYIPDSQRRIAVLQQAANLLAEGGHVVLSVLRHPPRSRLVRLAMAVNRWTRADWTMSEGDVFTRVVGSAVRYEHYFSAGEVEAELAAGGLQAVAELEGGTVWLATVRN